MSTPQGLEFNALLVSRAEAWMHVKSIGKRRGLAEHGWRKDHGVGCWRWYHVISSEVVSPKPYAITDMCEPCWTTESIADRLYLLVRPWPLSSYQGDRWRCSAPQPEGCATA